MRDGSSVHCSVDPSVGRDALLGTWQAAHYQHAYMQTPDNSMATSSHPPMSASIVASVTPQSTSPTATSSERGGSDSAGATPNGAGGVHAQPGLAPGRRPAGQPGEPMPADHAMGAEDPVRCAFASFTTSLQHIALGCQL